MFCIVNIVGPTVRDVIAADIILSRVMIKRYLITLLENSDAVQPTHLQSNKRFCASCFDSIVHVIIVAMSRNCEMSVRVVSKCSLLQHDVAHFCALGRIIGQTELVLINKDQKDRSSRIRLCELIETREFEACLVR